MWGEVIQGIFIPFLGTSLGAVCVLFMKNKLSDSLKRAMSGFAAGVMVAASVWSLLIPAMEQSASMGRWAFVPAVSGFWIGVLFLLLLDRVIFKLKKESREMARPWVTMKRTTMLELAVTLHNIPEGMAVGVAFAGYLSGNNMVTMAGAMSLSIGIAIQNIPEGAIISMPLKAEGMKKGKAFLYGILSGAVEPVAAILTLLATGLIVPALPYLLSFAAGAMFFAVVEELIPASNEVYSNMGIVFFTFGFTVMLLLDVAFG